MKTLKELKNFILLWLTQSFSALGSSMTSFALVIWLYSDSGKGSGAAMLFFFMAVSGVIVCLIFRRIKALRKLK